MPFRLSLSLAVATGLAAALMAQTPQQTPVFRGKLELIQVDVTVLGPDGRPWRGLTIDDFELFDEGVPQTIRGFAEIHVPDASEGPKWLADSAPDVRTASDGRVLLFVLDDAQIRNDVGQKAETFAEIHRVATTVINQMGATDVAAVICTYSPKCAQDFTADRNLLRAALARFAPMASNTAGIAGSWQLDWSRQTAGVTEKIVQYLVEQPGRRKSLIYVSPSLPVRPLIWPPLPGNLNEAVTQDQTMRAFEHAYRSKVTVYGINPRGLATIVVGESTGADAVIRKEPLGPGPNDPRLPERSLATETGGFIVLGEDELSEGVAQIFRESGSYYLLGYEQPNHPVLKYRQVEKSRNLEIRVKRPGAVVRNKAGYVPLEPPKPPKKPVPPGDAAIAGILPKTDLPLRVSVAPFGIPGSQDARVAVTIGVSEPATDARVRDLLHVQMRAFTQRGEARGVKLEKFDAVLARGDASVFEIESELRLRPGVYALRFAVTSDRLGTTGSVYADVEVPDFARAPLSLSGVVLRAVTANTATTQRAFTARDSIEATLRVYQGVKPAPVSLRVVMLNKDSRIAHDATIQIQPEQFDANRAFDYRLLLPLQSLTPGPHLLRFEAVGNGTSTRRDVQFVVSPSSR